MFLIQILATLRTESLALLAANHSQRQREQYLLAQHVFEQNSCTLIIADLRFCVGHGELIAPGVHPERTIEQLKIALHILRNRFETAGTLQFEAGRQTSTQTYVFDYLMLAMMLFDQFGAAGGFKRSALANLVPEIQYSGLKFLIEIARTNF